MDDWCEAGRKREYTEGRASSSLAGQQSLHKRARGWKHAVFHSLASAIRSGFTVPQLRIKSQNLLFNSAVSLVSNPPLVSLAVDVYEL